MPNPALPGPACTMGFGASAKKIYPFGALLLAILFSLGHVAMGAVTVAALGGHQPLHWKECKRANVSALAKCNLEIYALAVAKASEEGAQLVVLPEGYGLVGRPAENDKQVFEPFLSQVGTNVCANSTVGKFAPQQFEISCLAKRHNIAVAANIFVTLTSNHTNRIQEIVFDPSGKVISTYSKMHLFPTEKKWAEPGPFRPTSFRYLDKTFGILVCFDGVYPYVSKDFSELDALKSDGVDTIVWSVGSMVPISVIGKSIAKRYNFSVIISEDSSLVTGSDSAGILSNTGVPYETQKDIPLIPPKDYTGRGLHVRLATY